MYFPSMYMALNSGCSQEMSVALSRLQVFGVCKWAAGQFFYRSSYLAIVLKETELVFDRYLFSCIYSLTVSQRH